MVTTLSLCKGDSSPGVHLQASLPCLWTVAFPEALREELCKGWVLQGLRQLPGFLCTHQGLLS